MLSRFVCFIIHILFSCFIVLWCLYVFVHFGTIIFNYQVFIPPVFSVVAMYCYSFYVHNGLMLCYVLCVLYYFLCVDFLLLFYVLLFVCYVAGLLFLYYCSICMFPFAYWYVMVWRFMCMLFALMCYSSVCVLSLLFYLWLDLIYAYVFHIVWCHLIVPCVCYFVSCCLFFLSYIHIYWRCLFNIICVFFFYISVDCLIRFIRLYIVCMVCFCVFPTWTCYVFSELVYFDGLYVC